MNTFSLHIARPAVRLAVCLTLFAAAQASTALAAEPAPPPQWWLSGSERSQYAIRHLAEARHDGERGARILHTQGDAKGFGTLMQAVDATPYRGQRITLSAWVRTQDADSAQLWLRIDGPNASLGLDNMDDRGIKGSTTWTRHEVVLDVPPDASALAYGLILDGKGQADLDSVSLEPTPQAPKTTLLYDAQTLLKEAEGRPFTPMPRVHAKPANLGFED